MHSCEGLYDPAHATIGFFPFRTPLDLCRHPCLDADASAIGSGTGLLPISSAPSASRSSSTGNLLPGLPAAADKRRIC